MATSVDTNGVKKTEYTVLLQKSPGRLAALLSTAKSNSSWLTQRIPMVYTQMSRTKQKVTDCLVSA